MRLISFDIGIKNMAYCLFDTSGALSILSWEVLNLMEDEREPTIPTTLCTEPTKATKQKAATVCGSPAKFTKGDKCYCMKHAKTCTYMMPNKNYTEVGLKKKKVDELHKIAASHFVVFREGCLKKEMVDTLSAFFAKNTLEPVSVSKKMAAGDMDLICIGRNMKRRLDQIQDIEQITHVIIENQISPIANRMKTLQGMLTQYFIMRGRPDICIEFISSSNKLKGFNVANEKKPETKEPDVRETENTDTKINKKELDSDKKKSSKTEYKKHKTDGIAICREFLESNTEWVVWKSRFNDKAFATKKDDLADSFLQGIWYLKNRKIITYAENLKINSVFLT